MWLPGRFASAQMRPAESGEGGTLAAEWAEALRRETGRDPGCQAPAAAPGPLAAAMRAAAEDSVLQRRAAAEGPAFAARFSAEAMADAVLGALQDDSV